MIALTPKGADNGNIVDLEGSLTSRELRKSPELRELR
jgi:hypothetical protein